MCIASRNGGIKMAWYDNAVFYHIYPLGLCGCAKENNGESENHFDKLTEWADHVKEIECTAIYIGPLFESVGHGYETTDYRMVDRRLGTNDDFKKWVKHCHDIGLKVIVDGVFNHTGRNFFAFEDIKQNRENSRYRDWYCNVNFYGNNEYNDGFCYDNWGGYNLLVKLNLRNPEVKNYHYDTIRFWINEFDIDGIRLDAADVLDFDFMSELRHVTDGLKPEFWLMGEVIHGDYSRWANNNMLHSVTNYELHKGLFSGHNDHNYFEIAHSIKRLNDICRGIKLYTFTDNHDVERIGTKLNNKAHLYNVALLQYTVPGIPSIYYGSEFSIEGRKENGSDWPLRPCLNLEDFKSYYKNNEVTKLFKKLGRLKKQFPELTYGDYRELYLTTGQFAFARVLDNQAIIIALNNHDNPAHMEINLPIGASNAVDLLANDIVEETPDVEDNSEELKNNILEKLEAANVSYKDFKKILKNIEKAVNANEDISSYSSIISDGIKEIQDNCNEIFTAAGCNTTPCANIGDLSQYKQCNLDNGRLIVDLPANYGTVILVK